MESVPGQPIYPLKKVVENIQLKLASGELERANLQIKFADKRLEELERVLAKSKEGEIPQAEAEIIVSNTIKDLQKITAEAVSSSTKVKSNQPKVTLLTKLTEQSAVLKSASIETEGQVKLEIEKALTSTQISREEALKNLERAGLKVEASPIAVEEKAAKNEVRASGKITALSENSVSIGTFKFVINKSTKFNNVEQKTLKTGDAVEISGEVKEDKTYALQITVPVPEAQIPSEATQ